MNKTAAIRAGLAVLLAFCGVRVWGQTADAKAPGEAQEEGIPVTDQLVISKCGTCHARDQKGNLSRISWERTTPEGWQEAIKRMGRLNGMKLSESDSRAILKYLATYHGLAPEEAKPVMFLAERRSVDEKEAPAELQGVCNYCHAYSRALTWRRPKSDWLMLENMHMALFITSEMTFRHAFFLNPVASHLDSPPPGQIAADYLAKAAPLHTPEWSAWRARLRAPRLAGKWLVTASVPGRGKYYGEMTIEQGAAEDEFKTSVKLKSASDGSVLTRTGQSIVYAGYAWRGRSKGSVGASAAMDDLNREARETIWISPDQNTAEGRWYWGDYQEFGYDVALMRASQEPTIYGVSVSALKTGAKGAQVRLFVDALPAKVTVADLDLGAGIKVNRIVSSGAGEIVADVDVASDAVFGKRDAKFGRSSLPNAIAVYDHLDYIKVTPQTALAHLGSETHPKGYQQFEAIGYNRGADGKAQTADDVELGPVEVNWSVEEFYAIFGDDDKGFVGHLSPTALFIPASDGPNPERKFMRNNYGDVWVVATSKTEKDSLGKPVVGKAYLVVTVPTYMKWDQPEVNP
jgi:quinohemoprotein amine dehydrogenase